MTLDTMGIEFDDFAKVQLDRCEEFLVKVEEPERSRLEGTLGHAFDMLRRLGNARLGYDFAPLSFGFSAGGFQGGLIFHGLEGVDPLCITLDNRAGWQLHT